MAAALARLLQAAQQPPAAALGAVAAAGAGPAAQARMHANLRFRQHGDMAISGPACVFQCHAPCICEGETVMMLSTERQKRCWR